MRLIVSLTLFALLALVPSSSLASATDGANAAKEKPMTHAPLAGPEVAPNTADLAMTKLANGLTVAIKRDTRFPLASLRLYVHAGSAYETPEQAGISHLLEHMVFKGTTNRPKGAIAAEVEQAGGYLNAATSFDYTVYLTDMPAREWKLGLDVLKDMAFHPALDPEELEAEKKVVLSELQRGEDSPHNRLFKRVQRRALAGTPYERPIIGYTETILAITPEAIRNYIRDFYQPQSMLLLVVGDVEETAVLEEAKRLFGDLRNTADTAPPAVIPLETLPPRNASAPLVLVEKTPWNKAHLSIAFPCFDQNDARAAALTLFTHRLGGDKTSWLYTKYKYDKRLVDSIDVADYTFERTGIFSITVVLDEDNVAPFWKEFTKDMASLATTPLSEEELDRARLAVTDAFYRQRETVAGTASMLGQFLFFNGPHAETNYLRQIALADRDSIAAVASDILRPERATVTLFVPDKTTRGETWADTMTASFHESWPADDTIAKTVANPTLAMQYKDLGQGRTLILLPDTSMPYASVSIAFAGGDSLLPPDKQGLASTMASALTRGTKTMNATQIEAFKSNRAASLSAASSRESFRVSMEYPARFEADMLRLLADTLANPAFADTEIARVKENQIAAIISRDDRPLDYAFSRLFPFLFGGHIYGYSALGNKEGVSGFTPAQIASFWKQQQRQKWVMVVCGTFNAEAVLEAAAKLPIPAAMAPTVVPPSWTQEKSLAVTMPDRNQAHLMLVFPGVPLDHKDQPALELLREILAGQSGLLFRDLRDKEGLGYSVTALRWQAGLSGAILFYIGTEPEKMDAARQGFARVINGLHTRLLPEAELVRGKNQMSNDYIRARQRMSARSAEAASLVVRGRALTAEQNIIAKAQTLTPEDIQAIAQKYITLDTAYSLAVLPK